MFTLEDFVQRLKNVVWPSTVIINSTAGKRGSITFTWSGHILGFLLQNQMRLAPVTRLMTFRHLGHFSKLPNTFRARLSILQIRIRSVVFRSVNLSKMFLTITNILIILYREIMMTESFFFFKFDFFLASRSKALLNTSRTGVVE